MNVLKRATGWIVALMILISIFSMNVFADNSTMLYGIGFVNATGLNLRQLPGTDSSVLATANQGECIVVLGLENGWYHVLYNLQEGYMSADFLNVSTTENAELGYGSVTGNSVNLRSGPGTSYSMVGTATYGERLYIIGLNQGWFKVLRGSVSCYIRSDYLQLTEIPYENSGSASSPQYFRGGKAIGAASVSSTSAAAYSTAASTVSTGTGYATGAQIAEKAKQYLGTPYVYGGASPSGFDCSGFVYYVLSTFGYSPARTPSAQYEMGTYVDKSDLQPGDLVFFAGTNGSGITHSGIYVGDGQFIHAPNSRSTVSYSDLTTGYWSEHYYGARRVA